MRAVEVAGSDVLARGDASVRGLEAAPPTRMSLLARQGVALPRNITTTYHLASAYPFAVEAGLGVRGVFMGRNRLTGGGGFFFDLFEAHRSGLITAPNMCVTGAGGFGKSALAKTYVFRSSVLRGANARGRFVFVIDPKGEWTPLARLMGMTVIDLHPGGRARINPLDPGPAGRSVGSEEIARRQALVVGALLSVMLARPLDVSESRVLGYLLERIGRETLVEPTLDHLRHALANPTQETARELDTSLDELRTRCRPMLDVSAMLLDHQYRGMFDGPTTLHIDWQTSPGVVLNLSEVLDQPVALQLALICGAALGQALMHGSLDRLLLNIIDEGYKALQNEAMIDYLLDCWKVGRQFGSGNLLIVHALSELRAFFDDSAAAAKKTEALLNTTPVRGYLHQNHDQVADLLTRSGLPPVEARLLPSMPAYQTLWKIGEYTALVDNPAVGPELEFCDTNRVMGGHCRRRESAEIGISLTGPHPS